MNEAGSIERYPIIIIFLMTRKTPTIYFLPLCVNSISMTTIFKKEGRGLVDLSSFMNVCGYAAVAQDMP